MNEKTKNLIINSDKGRIRQILMNLVTNSWKFTFEGHIKIVVDVKEIGSNNFIEISVEDTGIGIKEEDQQNLFKLFGMVSENKNINPHGCGIGLTICKKIIEKLKGTISMESKFKIGTIISLKIPYKSQESNLFVPKFDYPNKYNSENRLIFSRLESDYQKEDEFEDKQGLVDRLGQNF
mmetsp:Transcript_28688/g.25393  ORF Transcript_28688/g.25393 Transcript_28688/m.25393 type:complete len:179 (+) Transcript_28688:801-1337(+)